MNLSSDDSLQLIAVAYYQGVHQVVDGGLLKVVVI
jgi:hypothetical protein